MGHLPIRPNQNPSMNCVGSNTVTTNTWSLNDSGRFSTNRNAACNWLTSLTYRRAQENEEKKKDFISVCNICNHKNDLPLSPLSSWRGCSLTRTPPGRRQTKRHDHDQNPVTSGEKEYGRTVVGWITRKSTGSCGLAVQHSIRPWVSVGMTCSTR